MGWRVSTGSGTNVECGMRLCQVEGCGNPYEARGYCTVHYSRWKRHGGTEAKFIRSTLTIAELVEEINWLRGGGVSPALICVQLGVRRESLQRRLSRAGIPELAVLFEAEQRVS